MTLGCGVLNVRTSESGQLLEQPCEESGVASLACRTVAATTYNALERESVCVYEREREGKCRDAMQNV